jgi:hypothetical protein
MNPILEFKFGANLAPEFSPNLKLAYDTLKGYAIGLEYYGG